MNTVSNADRKQLAQKWTGRPMQYDLQLNLKETESRKKLRAAVGVLDYRGINGSLKSEIYCNFIGAVTFYNSTSLL